MSVLDQSAIVESKLGLRFEGWAIFGWLYLDHIKYWKVLEIITYLSISCLSFSICTLLVSSCLSFVTSSPFTLVRSSVVFLFALLRSTYLLRVEKMYEYEKIPGFLCANYLSLWFLVSSRKSSSWWLRFVIILEKLIVTLGEINQKSSWWRVATRDEESKWQIICALTSFERGV